MDSTNEIRENILPFSPSVSQPRDRGKRWLRLLTMIAGPYWVNPVLIRTSG